VGELVKSTSGVDARSAAPQRQLDCQHGEYDIQRPASAEAKESADVGALACLFFYVVP
jgi:hypothetical protein